MSNDQGTPTDIYAYYEAVASQEEIYLEETEEEVRAILISNNPSPQNEIAERWEKKLEQLERGWGTSIDDLRN
ncbi:MAG: hypothetical protein C5B58_15955 [Acidobacteria bacterium]|nr:MAG: hypothetical protein C5B58_15955 [Acidobacteriota bacterium]